MGFKKVTMAEAMLGIGKTKVYALVELQASTTLAEFLGAQSYVIEDPDEDPEVVILDPDEDPEMEERAKKKQRGSFDHDEIIQLASEGYPPKEIAEIIGCSEQTVRNHIKGR